MPRLELQLHLIQQRCDLANKRILSLKLSIKAGEEVCHQGCSLSALHSGEGCLCMFFCWGAVLHLLLGCWEARLRCHLQLHTAAVHAQCVKYLLFLNKLF
jgi:hypothetical protein